MRLWVTGAGGLVGVPLVRELESRGHRLEAWDRSRGDLTRASDVIPAVEAFRPQAVIHLAAMTAVDLCETESEEAFRVNVEGTRAVATAAERAGAACLVLSSDYVFDGRAHRPYTETDPTHPLSVYGKSKLRAEEAALEACSRALIVRTAWLFGPDGPNFVDTMMRLGNERETVAVVSDQCGSPTYVPYLVRGLSDLVEGGVHGLFHLAGGGSGTWYDLACAAFARRGWSTDRVQPVPTSDVPRPAPRPAYSVLDCTRVRDEAGVELPSWRNGIEDYLKP